MSVEAIREHGWRQGSILSTDLAAKALEAARPKPNSCPAVEASLFIVVSQDCDIVQRDLALEPWVEIVPATRIESPDGNFKQLKNPRRLHFSATANNEVIWCEADIHHRFLIPRELLGDEAPRSEVQLDSHQLNVLVRWIARRYERPAMPDAFNERVRRAEQKVAKSLRTVSAVVEQIFVAITPWGELPENQSYRLRVVASMTKEDSANLEKVRTAKEALDKVEAALSNVAGIELDEDEEADFPPVHLVSEADFSLADVRMFRIWDFERLSFTGEPT